MGKVTKASKNPSTRRISCLKRQKCQQMQLHSQQGGPHAHLQRGKVCPLANLPGGWFPPWHTPSWAPTAPALLRKPCGGFFAPDGERPREGGRGRTRPWAHTHPRAALHSAAKSQVCFGGSQPCSLKDPPHTKSFQKPQGEAEKHSLTHTHPPRSRK